MTPLRVPQRGFAAIAAIFLVVLLAALGGFMVTFSTSQQVTSAQDVQGSRAYWAARAGLEWAIVNVNTTPGVVCPNTVKTAMPGAPTQIEGFDMVISCTRSNFTDGGASLVIYRMESQASLGSVGNVGFIERNVSASLEQP
jgi:MSHA biogenesis protein MshP